MAVNRRKRRHSYRDEIWPKRRPKELANTVVAMKMDDWSSVEHFSVNQKELTFKQYFNASVHIRDPILENPEYRARCYFE